MLIIFISDLSALCLTTSINLLFRFALSSSLTYPQKKIPFRVDLDLYFIAGKRTVLEEEMYKKTASFLGSAGASLVDLDNLFSSNPNPKQHPLTNALAAQTQAIGKDGQNTWVWVKKTVVHRGFTLCILIRWMHD